MTRSLSAISLVAVYLGLFVAGTGVELVLIDVLALLGVLAVVGVDGFGWHHDVVDGGLGRCVVAHVVTVEDGAGRAASPTRRRGRLPHECRRENVEVPLAAGLRPSTLRI